MLLGFGGLGFSRRARDGVMLRYARTYIAADYKSISSVRAARSPDEQFTAHIQIIYEYKVIIPLSVNTDVIFGLFICLLFF